MYAAIKTGEAISKGGILIRILTNPAALAAVAAITGVAWTANRAYDNVQVSNRADEIRKQFGPADEPLNINQLQGPQLRKVLQQFPAASNEDIVKMIRGGGVKLAAPDFTDMYSSPEYKVYINEALSKQLLDPGKSPFNISGPNKKSAEELKKERQEAAKAAKKADADAIAAAELDQRTAFAAIDQTREEDLEANKEWLRKRQMLHEEERIGDAEWIESQRQFKASQAMIDADAIDRKIAALNDEWVAKRDHYAEGKDLNAAYATYSVQFDKLVLDATKASNAEQAANDEARIASLKLKKKTAAEAAKEAADLAKAQAAAASSNLSRQLSSVESDEKAGILSTVDALNKKIDILQQLEALQQRELDTMIRTTAEEITAWNSQANKISETRQRLIQLETELLQRDPIEGAKRALRSYVDAAENMGQQVENTFTRAFSNMEDALVRFVQTGKLDFKDLANSIIADLIRIQVRASITGPLAAGLQAGISSFFGGSSYSSLNTNAGGASMSGGLMSSAPVYKHDGGIIVPRFHFGGLASDEVPAVLLTKERVLSREQNVLFEKFVNKTEGGSGGATNIKVEIINQTGQPLTGKQNGLATQIDPENMVVSIILNNVENNGALNNLFRR